VFRLPQRLLEHIPIRHKSITRKRIGRNVEDAHHHRAGTPGKDLISDLKGWGFH
jgi:hypothetical protein